MTAEPAHPGRMSSRALAKEEYDPDPWPLSLVNDGPRNRCDICGSWQAEDADGICQPCAQDIDDERRKEWWS